MTLKHFFILFTLLVNAVYVSAQYSGPGTGTEEDPYLILNAAQFYSIRNFPNTQVYFSLLTDIDLSDYSYGSGWEPIPDFQGVLNGNGHTIKGLKINKKTTDEVGLFAQTFRATIKNITVEGDVVGNDYVGGIVGKTLSSHYDVEYQNVHFIGTVQGNNCVGGIGGSEYPHERYSGTGPGIEYSKCSFSGTVIGVNRVGGLVGSAVSRISNSFVIATISANQYVGGMCGNHNASGISGNIITDCYASVNIFTTADFVGGIAGVSIGSEIRRSCVNGKIESLGNKVGGIIGYASTSSGVRHDFNISDSYFTGYLKANDFVGGIMGYNGGDVWLDSYNQKCWGYVRVQNNYVRATIIGHDKVGGILSGYSDTFNPKVNSNICMCPIIESEIGNIGRIQASEDEIPEKCYSMYSTKVVVAGIPLTDEIVQAKINCHGTDIDENNLKTASFYQGLSWDFGSNWSIINTECFPYLQTQSAPPSIQSSLTKGETCISGNSIDGGIVNISVKGLEYSIITNSNEWSISVPELQAGVKVIANVKTNNFFPSYNVERCVSYLGEGTPDNPYLIESVSDLMHIHGGGCYKLTKDIDLADMLNNESPSKGWQPLRIYSSPITNIDGDNHTITNLFISRETDLVGLFANLTDATIKNLTIETFPDKNVHGINNVGILAGRLNNCTIENVSIVGNADGNLNVGGLAGQINGGTIENINISSSIVGKNNVGGIAGVSSASANLCLFNGDVRDDITTSDGISANSTVYVGGLFAISNGSYIAQSITKGNIIGIRDGSKVGGLVGDNYSAISNCYSLANVEGNTCAAGIVANNHSVVNNCYASGDISTTNKSAVTISCGLIGYNDGLNAEVSQCAVMNKYITSSSDIGKVFRIIGGIKNEATIPNTTNFATQNMILSVNGLRLSLSDDPFNGYMRSDDSFLTQSLYENNGWDFSTVWEFTEDQMYPTLQQLHENLFETSNVLINNISFEKTSFCLEVDDKSTIIVNINPENATNKDLIWVSSNPDIAVVENGEVLAKSSGKTIVTATTIDGSNLSASCEITIVEKNTNYFSAQDMEVSHGVSFDLPIELINEDNITGFQCDIYLPNYIKLAIIDDEYDISLSNRATSSHTLSSALQNDGSVRILAYSTSSKLFAGNEGTLFNLKLSTSESFDEDVQITIKNIVITTPNEIEYNPTDLIINISKCKYVLGDTNGDNVINVTDVVRIANYVLGNIPSSFIFEAADIKADGVINVSDIVGVSNIILNGPSTKSTMSLKSAEKVNINTSNIVLDNFMILPGERKEIAINIDNAEAYTALQLDIKLPLGLKIENSRLGDIATTSHIKMENELFPGNMRILSYSTQNINFKSNNNALILKIEADNDFNGGEIVLSDIIAVNNKTNETQIKDVITTVSVPCGTEYICSGNNICVENRNIIIESTQKQVIKVSSVDGMVKMVDINVGKNIIPVNQVGLYIVTTENETKKIIIK